MLLLRLAFGNLLRHRRRSVLTGITIAGGCMLFSLFVSIADGSYASIIEAFTRGRTGHVQLHARGYLDKPSLHKTMDGYEGIGARLMDSPFTESWTPRIHASGLAFAGTKTLGVSLVGIDPAREASTTRIPLSVKEGAFLSDSDPYGALVSRGMARVLGVGVGNEFALISQAADGSIANALFRVRGIVDEGEGGYGVGICSIPLRTAQEFFSLEGRAHEIVVVLKDQALARRAAREMASALADPALDVEPWQSVERQFYRAMQADLRGHYISLVILTVIVSLGVLNTILMMILERTREFGVMRALGTRPSLIVGMVLVETTVLALLSIAVGLCAAVIVDQAFLVKGISTGTPVEYGGVVFEKIVGRVTPRSVLLPAAVIWTASILVSIAPAIKAARISPVAALRSM
jgi:ABC-type lipoprotein release transport system permease subunit